MYLPRAKWMCLRRKCTRASYFGAASTREKPIFCVWRGRRVSIDCPIPISCFEGSVALHSAHASTSMAFVRMNQMPVRAEKATSRVVFDTNVIRYIVQVVAPYSSRRRRGRKFSLAEGPGHLAEDV